MATIGCADVQILAQPRGGRSGSRVIGVGSARNWSTVEWHYLSSSISGAQFRIEGRAQCCDWAAKVKPWRDEMCVFYDGGRVWSGPVTEVNWVGDELRIDCKDRMEWMRRRRLHNLLSYSPTVDLVSIFKDVVEDALSVDTSPNLTVVPSLSGSLVNDPDGRVLDPGSNTYANDIINETGRGELYWTCIDRKVYVSGPPTDVHPRLLRAIHFEGFEPDGILDGGAFGTRWNVVGSGRGADVDTTVGTNPVVDAALEAEFGVHERIIAEPRLTDVASCTAEATSLYEQYGQDGIPFYLTGGTLSPSAPVGVSELRPGKLFRVEATDRCKPVPQFVRLTGVTGAVGPEHQYISVTFDSTAASTVAA